MEYKENDDFDDKVTPQERDEVIDAFISQEGF